MKSSVIQYNEQLEQLEKHIKTKLNNFSFLINLIKGTIYSWEIKYLCCYPKLNSES